MKKEKQIIAKSKSYAILYWVMLLSGLITLITLGFSVSVHTLVHSPFSFGAAGLICLVVFFLLPVYGLFSKEELIIQDKTLALRSYPFKSEKTFDLRKLATWEITSALGRYTWGRTICLHLIDEKKVKRKVLISEMQFRDFDTIVAYFDSAFGRVKTKS